MLEIKAPINTYMKFRLKRKKLGATRARSSTSSFILVLYAIFRQKSIDLKKFY